MDNTNMQGNVPPQNIGVQGNVPPQNMNVQGAFQQYQGGVPPYFPNVNSPYGETEQQRHARSDHFQAMFLPTLLYALFYTFFLYDNLSSITMPLFVATTVMYCLYAMRKTNVAIKKTTWFYAAVMLLLGISTACTDNSFILFFNNLGIVLLLVCMLLHNYFDDRQWKFGKYVAAFFTAVFGAIGSLTDPFSDAGAFHKDNRRRHRSKMMYILLGIVIAIPLLVVIVMLLYYADAVFARFIRDIRLNLSLGTLLGIFLMFAFAFMSAYCGLRYLGRRTISEKCEDYRRFEPLVAITVLSLISVVYVFFSIIQILYLFWGKMELPEGHTYASYAHEGFFQLLFVCMINVAVVLFVLAFFRKDRVINVLLTVISACTYVMLASSALRMYLYVQAYSLSFLRILVFWGLALIALLLAGIVVQIFREDFHLFQYGLVVVCVCYLVLSFSHTDYWIAEYNLSQIAKQSEADRDYSYLSRLSADAAPAIAGEEGDWVDRYVYRLSRKDRSLRQYNFSVGKAKWLFKEELGRKKLANEWKSYRGQ